MSPRHGYRVLQGYCYRKYWRNNAFYLNPLPGITSATTRKNTMNNICGFVACFIQTIHPLMRCDSGEIISSVGVRAAINIHDSAPAPAQWVMSGRGLKKRTSSIFNLCLKCLPWAPASCGNQTLFWLANESCSLHDKCKTASWTGPKTNSPKRAEMTVNNLWRLCSLKNKLKRLQTALLCWLYDSHQNSRKFLCKLKTEKIKAVLFLLSVVWLGCITWNVEVACLLKM